MKSAVRALGALALFGALAVAHTWPLASLAATHISGGRDGATGTWVLYDVTTQVLNDPAHPMNGNNLYPFTETLAVLDHQIGNTPLAAPLVLAGASPALTYNVTVILTFVLSGFFTCLLVLRLTGSWVAGLVAGCAFAFGTFRTSSIMHAHVLPTQWLPLALLTLDRFIERPRPLRWAAFTAATMLVALSSWHIAVLGSVAIGIVALWALAAQEPPQRARVAGLGLTAGVCGAALLPLAMTYSRVGGRWPLQTPDGGELLSTLVKYSADLSALVVLPVASMAPYASALAVFQGNTPGIFPGLVTLALALPAVLFLRRQPRGLRGRGAVAARAVLWLGATLCVAASVAAIAGDCCAPLASLLGRLAPFVVLGLGLAGTGLLAARRVRGAAAPLRHTVTYAALATAGALLALGPRVHAAGIDLGSGVWRLDLLPLPLLMRAPIRFAMLLSFGLAVLAGLGVARALQNVPRRRAAALAIAALVVLNADLVFESVDTSPAPVANQTDRWLADSPQPGAVVVYPLVGTNYASYSSQRFGRRVVNGAGYLAPPEVYQLEALPDLSPEQLEMLWRYFHPRFVLIRGGAFEDRPVAPLLESIAARPETFRPLVSDGDDHLYELLDRGNGAALFRQWPRQELSRLGNAVVLDGLVGAGRPGTVTSLVVSLNGHELLALPGTETERAFSVTVPFEPTHLVDGINTLEILADYRFTADAERNEIGATGVSVAADITVVASPERSLVEVNGRYLAGEKGYLLVELDPSAGTIARSAHFNTSWFEDASRELAAFVRRVPEGAPVIVVSEFDVSRALRARTVNALRELGIEADLRRFEGYSHAAIGVKGAPAGSALEMAGPGEVRLTLGQIDRPQVQLSNLQVQFIEPSASGR